MPSRPGRTVGIVGLGIMGGATSRNLLAAGWTMCGFDLGAERRAVIARFAADPGSRRRSSPQPRRSTLPRWRPGLAALDTAAMCRVLERRAGLERGAPE